MTPNGEREAAVQFEGVSLSFDEKRVLHDVSFRLQHGETKVILGATGSGKSVILKLTIGLLQPDSGHIRVLGEPITEFTEEKLFLVRKHVGMVFQEGALFDSLSVGENVGYVFQRMPEVATEEVARRVREALRFVELEQTLDSFPSELSGGMRRRVAIARAMVGQPQIMLYDSPTAGLDPITATRIMTLVVKGRDVSQVSSLLVTHRIQDAFKLALFRYDAKSETLTPAPRNDGIADAHTGFLVLREGVIVFDGSLQQLLAQQDPYVQKFLA